MAQNTEQNFYAFTACSGYTLIQRVAEKSYDLCRSLDDTFSVFERAPGLYCTGCIADGRYRLLEFRQVPGFTEADAFAKCFEEPTSLQRLRELNKVSKQVKVHVALGCVPSEFVPELPGWTKWILRGWREVERRRINPDRPYALPWACEEWHPEVRAQYAKRETSRWRTICFNPAAYTSEDVFFQLALILLQERMVSEADVEALRESMVYYLCRTMRGRLDAGTAHLVLARLLSHFAEPTHARGVESYIKSYLAWTKRYLSWDCSKEQPQVFNTRRVTGAGDLMAVDDALTQ